MDTLINPCNESLWQQVLEEVAVTAREEPLLAGFLHATILNHNDIASALSFLLANKLHCNITPALMLREVFDTAIRDDPTIIDSVRCDIIAIYERDSACRNFSTSFLYYKGFHALAAYRVAHWLWQHQRQSLALVLQNRISVVFGVDIHPAAKIGKGILFDHATSLVIGETAVVEDCVSILQSVTLGGTGKETEDRHPKVRRGVLIGPGATILGNIEIGEGSKVTAASVVLKDVPPHSIVAGVPGKVVGTTSNDDPAEKMDHGLEGCGSD
ncbi:MAG: serine O-acetyltransferase [Gammaproteobacteria bacterium]|nr:MAG: serine O-acetyltransferase [Gammaproteobacteria bacterium]RLA53262.1 MAG: serine O-acetyltransferase [Gammaproteobacteria bacterium]